LIRKNLYSRINLVTSNNNDFTTNYNSININLKELALKELVTETDISFLKNEKITGKTIWSGDEYSLVIRQIN